MNPFFLFLVVFVSSDLMAETMELSQLTVWKLERVIKNEKCYRYYRNEIIDFSEGKTDYAGNDLIILVDELAEHKRLSWAYFDDLAGEGYLFEGNMASQYDAEDYAPYRKRYPQLAPFFRWQPSVEDCMRLGNPR